MDTEDLATYDGCERQAVEDLGKALPDIRISVFLAALIIEAICLRNGQSFVVPSQQRNPISVPNFQSQQKGEGLH